MTYADKHIIETYLGILEGLSTSSKIELVENLSKSLKTKEKTKETRFYKSFGAFASSKDAKEIIADIRSSRKFRDRNLASFS